MYTFNILKNNFNDISYISSDESVIELYNEYGDGFHSHIDGQFLLIVRDGYHLNFFTDPWGSYQVNYFNSDSDFRFANFTPDWGDSQAEWIERFRRRQHWGVIPTNIFVPINSHSRFDTRNKTLEIVNSRLHSWKFDNKKNDNMDIVEEKFNEVVLEKWESNCTLFLSSGVDSCAIAVCLTDNNKKFNALCNMFNPEFEDESVINATINYCGENINYERVDSFTPEEFLNTKTNADYNNKNKATVEIYHRSKNIFKSNLVITGFGSDDTVDKDDQIISSGSEFQSGGVINEMLEWNKSTCGSTSFLLNYQEKYALDVGINLRHVYYSKKLIQSWHNLDDRYKTMKKPFTRKYITDRGLPFTETTKSGFGHQSTHKYSYNEHRRMTEIINNLKGVSHGS